VGIFLVSSDSERDTTYHKPPKGQVPASVGFDILEINWRKDGPGEVYPDQLP
jgi:hypothetical protein